MTLARNGPTVARESNADVRVPQRTEAFSRRPAAHNERRTRGSDSCPHVPWGHMDKLGDPLPLRKLTGPLATRDTTTSCYHVHGAEGSTTPSSNRPCHERQ